MMHIGSSDEPICKAGIETQIYRKVFWTQRGKERVR